MILWIKRVDFQWKDKFQNLQRLIIILITITLIHANNYKDQIILKLMIISKVYKK